jgi:hypothetical protein
LLSVIWRFRGPTASEVSFTQLLDAFARLSLKDFAKAEPKATGADLPPEFNALRYNARFEDANGPFFFHGLAAIKSKYVRQPPGRFLTL